MERVDLAKGIYYASHLEGDFLLRSGERSSEYYDKFRFESDPRLLQGITTHLAPYIPQRTELLGGLELGGVAMATALSLHTGIHQVFVRKEAKKYGTQQIVEGAEVKGKHICMVEDIVTTGGQIIACTKQIRQLGATVADVLCVIVRDERAINRISAINSGEFAPTS